MEAALMNADRRTDMMKLIGAPRDCATRLKSISIHRCAPYQRVIHPKTYSGYVKTRIIPNAIHHVIFV
jgi:hypothetical protein